jgi:hypothetical protein
MIHEQEQEQEHEQEHMKKYEVSPPKKKSRSLIEKLRLPRPQGRPRSMWSSAEEGQPL